MVDETLPRLTEGDSDVAFDMNHEVVVEEEEIVEEEEDDNDDMDDDENDIRWINSEEREYNGK